MYGPNCTCTYITRWQHLWHNSTSNKLHNIYPTLPISSKYPKAQLTCQEQTLYNRLRIGHTYLTHSYLLKDEDPPIYIPCNSLLTVEHRMLGIGCLEDAIELALNKLLWRLLAASGATHWWCMPNNDDDDVEHVVISCIKFDIICRNIYTASNLKDLFHNIHPKCIISFVHAIGLTDKL